MKRHPSFEELSELIVDAIIEEPIFSKQKIMPRIKAILTAFNLKMSRVPDIENEETAKEKHKRLIHIQNKEEQVLFWKRKCQEFLPEKMNDFYNEIDKI